MLTLYEMHNDGLLIWQLEFYFLETEKKIIVKTSMNHIRFSVSTFLYSLFKITDPNGKP